MNRRIIPDEPMKGELLRIGPLTLNLTTRYLAVDGGEPVYLRPRESALLHLLMRRPDQVLTHKVIWQAVWGSDSLEDFSSLYVHVRWLREKIEADPRRPACLQTVRSVGYRLRVQS
jgi:DNA-binding response OmpR family regulator